LLIRHSILPLGMVVRRRSSVSTIFRFISMAPYNSFVDLAFSVIGLLITL